MSEANQTDVRPPDRPSDRSLGPTRWPWPHRFGLSATFVHVTLFGVFVIVNWISAALAEAGLISKMFFAQPAWEVAFAVLFSWPAAALHFAYVSWLGLCWLVERNAPRPPTAAWPAAAPWAWFDDIVHRSLGPGWGRPARLQATLSAALSVLLLSYLADMSLAGDADPGRAEWWSIAFSLVAVCIGLPWLIWLDVAVFRAVMDMRRASKHQA
jgi:hypothetical protein